MEFVEFVVRPGAKPRFFAKPGAFGAWLAKNGGKRDEILVGYWKVGTGKPSMTWAESVEQALMHGWIDGRRNSLGDEAYTIRFTPRRRGSNWSDVNLRLAKKLLADGRMGSAGRKAYEARRKGQPALGSYEQRGTLKFGPMELKRFKADAKAWAWFTSSAPSYQKACIWYIQSAKKPETKERRLAHVMAHAHDGEVAPQYRWKKANKKATTGAATRGKAMTGNATSGSGKSN